MEHFSPVRSTHQRPRQGLMCELMERSVTIPRIQNGAPGIRNQLAARDKTRRSRHPAIMFRVRAAELPSDQHFLAEVHRLEGR